MRTRVAVLASGGGTNLQALLDHLDWLGEARAADVVLVATDREKAGALDRAAARRIPAVILQTGTRPEGVPLGKALADYNVGLVVLAGYLRKVPPDVVAAYEGRILNVHPALLPAFGGAGMYGARVHEAVLASGAGVTGVTVHLIDNEYDRGSILAQWPVPVLSGDDAAALGARVLRVEHALYPRVIDAFAAGKLRAEPAVRAARQGQAFVRADPDDDTLAAAITRSLRA